MKCRTGKQCFATEKEARDKMWQIQFWEVVCRHPKRVYRCKFCGFWHLTSQDYKPKIKQAEEEEART